MVEANILSLFEFVNYYSSLIISNSKTKKLLALFQMANFTETVNATVLRSDPQPPSPKFHIMASYLTNTAINFSLVKAK